MTVISRVLILLSGLFFAIPLVAVNPKDFLYSDALSVACKVGSPMQEDLMYCISRDYIESDKNLYLNYQKSLKALNSKQKIKLKIEQKKWLKLKDQKCNIIYESMNGGREAPIEFLSCHTEENVKRTQILKSNYMSDKCSD